MKYMLQLTTRNTKDHKRLWWTVIYQQIGQPRRSKFLEIYNLQGLNHEETENLNRKILVQEVESVTKKPLKKRKLRNKMDSLWILPNIQRRVNAYPSQTLPKKLEGKLPNSLYEASITLISKPDKDTTKSKLQANISDEHRHKNPEQNISTANPTLHRKDHLSWSSGIYTRGYTMVQHPQINQCDTPH